MIIGIDHGYYAIKTRNCSFPAGITPFGDREPYTRQNVLTFGGCFFVCGSGRQPIQRDKTANDNYYLLTLAAIAKEIETRGAPRECSVTIAAGLPLTSYGREKPAFRKYLLRNAGQTTEFGYEGKKYRTPATDTTADATAATTGEDFGTRTASASERSGGEGTPASTTSGADDPSTDNSDENEDGPATTTVTETVLMWLRCGGRATLSSW